MLPSRNPRKGPPTRSIGGNYSLSVVLTFTGDLNPNAFLLDPILFAAWQVVGRSEEEG
jgi:hypothetical protein